MSLQMFMWASLIIQLCFGTIEYQRNISCSDVETTNGFNFSHECPVGSEISASYNKTQIAVATPGRKPEYLPEVISMDDCSVVTRECRDLNVKCVSFGQHVKETWIFFKVIEEIKNPDLQTPWSLSKFGLSAGGIMLPIVVFIGLLVCLLQREMMVRMWHRAATVPGFFTHLCHSCCCREGNSEAELPETADTSMVDLHGSGENDTEQDVTLEAVEVHSGDISAPDDNRAAHHRAMNRNLRDDPGGRDSVTITKIHSGCVRGDQGPDDHEAEGESLLSNERANIQGPDMTSEAIALVNKCGFGPDQVSRRFDAPNTDVESMPKMKNRCIDKYC